jgi:hypothetical protein
VQIAKRISKDSSITAPGTLPAQIAKRIGKDFLKDCSRKASCAN